MFSQPGILQPQLSFARYLTGRRRLRIDAKVIRTNLLNIKISDQLILGLGLGLSRYLGQEQEELRAFPSLSGVGIEVPSTQADLWIWLNSDEPGLMLRQSYDLKDRLNSLFEFDNPVDGFKYGETENGLGRDLTGYEDGTENPEGDAASAAALSHDGSSFVAVQMWKHDLNYLSSFSQEEQDKMIGRRRVDNEELEDAPPSAHVKRTAQESFDPEAWILRRSMPWSGVNGEGLMFVAFGRSLDAFESQMRRMAGLEDGIIDACFRFSRPLTGGYYWCPPLLNGVLLLS